MSATPKIPIPFEIFDHHFGQTFVRAIKRHILEIPREKMFLPSLCLCSISFFSSFLSPLLLTYLLIRLSLVRPFKLSGSIDIQRARGVVFLPGFKFEGDREKERRRRRR